MLEGPRKETFPPGLRARGKVWSLWSLESFEVLDLPWYIFIHLYYHKLYIYINYNIARLERVGLLFGGRPHLGETLATTSLVTIEPN